MASDTGLAGKRVVITGAGRGLGRVLAIAAADQGAAPVLLGRNPAALQGVADLIKRRAGGDPLVVPCDLSQPDSIRDACRIVLDAGPTVDVLINNGAPWLPGGLEELAEADIAATVAAAVTGTILVTKGLLPGLKQSSAADIVTIVSTAGWTGWDISGASAPFHAAKHGQSGFSDRLRHEVKGHGIRVAAIYPPDFDDVEPSDTSSQDGQGKLTAREVVDTVFFVIRAPRPCTYPVIIIDAMEPLRS